MKSSFLLILVVLTSFCVLLFMSKIPELWAVATFLSLFTFYGWGILIEDIERK